MFLMDYLSIIREDFPDYAKKDTWKILHTYIYAHRQRFIEKYTRDVIHAITIFKWQCANMTFSDKIRYNRLFQKVVHKERESKTNYIKSFKDIRLWKYLWVPTLRRIILEVDS